MTIENFRIESPEVVYTDQSFSLLGADAVSFLKLQAEATPRRRCRICCHPAPDAALHDMLIVHGRDAYVRPHKHLGKSESLHVVEGCATLVTFNEDGAIVQSCRLAPAAEGGNFLYYMPSGMFHTLLIESEWFVFHEATIGPFDRSTTIEASWSPADGDAAGEYIRILRQQIS